MFLVFLHLSEVQEHRLQLCTVHGNNDSYPLGWRPLHFSTALPPTPVQEVVVYLVQLDLELASTLYRSGKSIQILAPECKELLNAQAAECVITGIANPILLSHVHHLVVHMKGILQRKGDTQSCTLTPGESNSI